MDQFKTFVAAWAYRVDPDAEDAKRRAAADGFGFDLADHVDGVHVRGFLTPETGEALQTALTAVIGVPDRGRARPVPAPPRRAGHVVPAGRGPGGSGRRGGVRPQLVVAGATGAT